MKRQLKNGLIAGTVAASLIGAGFIVSAQNNTHHNTSDNPAMEMEAFEMEMMSFDFYRMGFMDGFESCYMMDDDFYGDEDFDAYEGEWDDEAFDEEFEEDVTYTELEQAPAHLSVTLDGFQFHSAEQATAEDYQGTYVTYIHGDDARFFTVSQESFAPLSDEEAAEVKAELEAAAATDDEGMDDEFMDDEDMDEAPVLEEILTINGTEVYTAVERIDGITEAFAFYETDAGVVVVEGELTKSQITSIVEQLLAK